MRCANGWAYRAGHRHAPHDEPFLRHSRSVDTGREANAIRIGDTEYLLTVTADAVHLTREAGPGETGKVPSSPGTSAPDSGSPRRCAATTTPRSPGPAGNGHAVRAGMAHHGWHQLVGRRRPGRGRRFRAVVPPLPGPHGQVVPRPELDDRFGPAVQAVTGSVAEQGYAGMWNVSGDQQAALRNQVRSAVKKRTGHPTQTLVRGSLLVFVCEPIHQHHAAERERAITQATGSVLTGQPAHPCPALAPVPGCVRGRVTVLMRQCRACRPRCGEDGE